MRRLALVGAVVLCGLVAVPAADAADPADAVPPGVVAVPGSARAGSFATPLSVVQAADRPSLVNADINWHGLASDAFGTDDRAWCGPLDPSRPESSNNPRRKPLGQCPLFATGFALPLGGIVAIEGLDAAVPGRVYSYRCTVVSGMTGNLVIAAVPNSGED